MKLRKSKTNTSQKKITKDGGKNADRQYGGGKDIISRNRKCIY